MAVFAIDVVVQESRSARSPNCGLLGHLEALTFQFERAGKQISCVRTYAEPDSTDGSIYRVQAAAETGYEGIACLDDTARAATLALGLYEQTRFRRALLLGRRWLSFVEYMQYPDGTFANFIRSEAGIRNASGPTSVKGGLWWSSRALLALSRAYRVTRQADYLERFQACRIDPGSDSKINALLVLGKLEVYRAAPSSRLRAEILEHCAIIVSHGGDSYFRDHPGVDLIHLWGYHQLHAVAAAAAVLDEPRLLKSCRATVNTLVELDVRAKFWHTFPDRSKEGVCAFDVTPLVQGLAAMYYATSAARYRDLALSASAWFYGRNDARTPMYNPSTGACRDGITDSVASRNYGAESAIEAGLAELERRVLLAKA